MSTDEKPKPYTVVTIKVDTPTAKAFKQLAKANNRNQSLLLRDFINSYVKKHGQLKLPMD